MQPWFLFVFAADVKITCRSRRIAAHCKIANITWDQQILGELLRTQQHFTTGTTNYVIPHHIINFAKNRYHTLPQQLHYLLYITYYYITYYYSNYILSTTTIRTRSLLMISDWFDALQIIYISNYTLQERIVWPISPQFEHFDSAFFLITPWSDDVS